MIRAFFLISFLIVGAPLSAQSVDKIKPPALTFEQIMTHSLSACTPATPHSLSSQLRILKRNGFNQIGQSPVRTGVRPQRVFQHKDTGAIATLNVLGDQPKAKMIVCTIHTGERIFDLKGRAVSLARKHYGPNAFGKVSTGGMFIFRRGKSGFLVTAPSNHSEVSIAAFGKAR